MSKGPIPGWVMPEPIQGATVEERVAFECERQGIPVTMPAEKVAEIGRIIAKGLEAKAARERAMRGAA